MTDSTLAALPTGMDAMDPAQLCAVSWLSEYQHPHTRYLYGLDLRNLFEWCAARDRNPLHLIRMELNAYRAYLETERRLSSSTVYRRLNAAQLYYRHAVDEGYLEKDPSARLRLPEVHYGDERKVWLFPNEVQALLAAARAASPTDWCLVSLLAILGLRVTSACDIDIQHIVRDRSDATWLHTVGKFGKRKTRPVPGIVLETMEMSAAGRDAGPLLLRRNGTRMTRRSATQVVKRLAKECGLPAAVSPHDLRRSFIANGLAAGKTLREMQLGADHNDVRTTASYDRAELAADRHPSMALADLYAPKAVACS
ncbi:tyrosine-type recombinase/integrase [Kineosporia babensis]|uniref:Tyrosine-type recombinase/integrase n=1 Tax=Kineosporia babensis TaxID=499548 RepID=A0A9X1NB19_9ACTN|nr:tyrosine-type recombinase/integrase [Kineosporia babensis]MCD5310823.1 tyrosine-type recombinase/integrase [Kineosporia babensis]